MNILDTWKGQIEINGQHSDSVDISSLSGAISIHLFPEGYQKTEEEKHTNVVVAVDDVQCVVKVRAWMTKPATPDFDFMDKFNKGVPMPLRVMVGKVVKESPKMKYMELHGDIIEEITQTCMCCGKPITNEISKYFGMGPVCGGHNYVNPFSSREELKKAVGDYRLKLRKITWEGWIPNSAIESMKPFEQHS